MYVLMSTPGDDPLRVLVRRLWRTLEPYHSLYLDSAGAPSYAAAGLKGGRMRYFAARSAPLGAVRPEIVVATFYGFHPRLVERSIPDAWQLATPERVIAARANAVDAAISHGPWSKVRHHPLVGEAVEVASRAVAACDVAGRALFAGHASLEAPREPAHVTLWWQLTLLREHRGDGHVGALLAEGVGQCDSLVMHSGTGEVRRDALQPIRGWTDEEWGSTAATLEERGWLDTDGTLSNEGHRVRRQVEHVTDRLTPEPWRLTGPGHAERLIDLLENIFGPPSARM